MYFYWVGILHPVCASRQHFPCDSNFYNPGKKLVDFFNFSTFLPYTMLLFMRFMLESNFILFNIVPGEGGGGGI